MDAVPDPVRSHPSSVVGYERTAGAGVPAETRVEPIDEEPFDTASIGPARRGFVDLCAERFFLAPDLQAVPRTQGQSTETRPRLPDESFAVDIARSSPIHDRDVKSPPYAGDHVLELRLVDVTGWRASACDGCGTARAVDPTELP